MLLPIGDQQVQGGYKPIFSYSFIAINIIFFLYQMTGSNLMVCDLGAVPMEITSGNKLYTLLTSMFMHGGIMHIAGNMLFLWIFADNIEATVGHFKFVIFYILGGVAAAFTHIFLGAGTSTLDCCMVCGGTVECAGDVIACAGSIPMVGASGAIAAALGAYLVMFPKSKIKTFIVFSVFQIPALFFLLFWIGKEIFSVSQGYLGNTTSDGVAYWAHIGGFVFGVLAGFLMRNGEDVKHSRENIENHYV